VTLVDETEAGYMMSEYYHEECARGLHWDDKEIGIKWPVAVTSISRQDASR